MTEKVEVQGDTYVLVEVANKIKTSCERCEIPRCSEICPLGSKWAIVCPAWHYFAKVVNPYALEL